MNLTHQLVDTMTWAASADKDVDLPLDGFITRIDLECSITGSGAMASAMATLGLWRVIQSLKIKGGSGKNYFNMSGVQMGVLLHAINMRDFPDVGTWHDLVATTQTIAWRIHFGSKPRDEFGRDNPFDLTAAIPAMDENNLKLIWSTTGNDAMDDTVTISAATMRVTVHKVLPPAGMEQAIKAGLMVPISSSESCDPGGTKSSLSYQRDIPTGGYIRRIAIAAQDDTAVGSNGPLFVADQVTEVGVYLSKANQWLIDGLRTKQLQLNNPKFDGMEVVDTPNTQSPWAPAGLYCLDMRAYDHRDFGLDVRGLRTSDVKLGMTIGAYASGEVEQVWYDQLLPYRA